MSSLPDNVEEAAVLLVLRIAQSAPFSHCLQPGFRCWVGKILCQGKGAGGYCGKFGSGEC